MPVPQPFPELVAKYRNKGVLVDTNLLVILLVGTFDRGQLRNCRATKAFVEGDFDLLNAFLRQFNFLITTPHILTEVSNLAGKLDYSHQVGFRKTLTAFIANTVEEQREARGISLDEYFPRLGITDTAIGMIAPNKYLVLTDELALYGFLRKQRVDVMNFNDIRMAHWQRRH
jgi:hypothetical protein